MLHFQHYYIGHDKGLCNSNISHRFNIKTNILMPEHTFPRQTISSISRQHQIQGKCLTLYHPTIQISAEITKLDTNDSLTICNVPGSCRMSPFIWQNCLLARRAEVIASFPSLLVDPSSSMASVDGQKIDFFSAFLNWCFPVMVAIGQRCIRWLGPAALFLLIKWIWSGIWVRW